MSPVPLAEESLVGSGLLGYALDLWHSPFPDCTSEYLAAFYN